MLENDFEEMRNEIHDFLFIYIKHIATQPLYSKQIDNSIMATGWPKWSKIVGNSTDEKTYKRKTIFVETGLQIILK